MDGLTVVLDSIDLSESCSVEITPIICPQFILLSAGLATYHNLGTSAGICRAAAK